MRMNKEILPLIDPDKLDSWGKEVLNKRLKG